MNALFAHAGNKQFAGYADMVAHVQQPEGGKRLFVEFLLVEVNLHSPTAVTQVGEETFSHGSHGHQAPRGPHLAPFLEWLRQFRQPPGP